MMKERAQRPGEEQFPRPDGFSRERYARYGRVWGFLLALALILALLTGIVRALACSAGEMEAAMRRFAPTGYTRLPEAEYPAVAAHIADYLAGRKENFQYMLAVSGGEAMPCFHDYEIVHMEDCRNLIRLDGIVCAASLAVAALALSGLLLMEGSGRKAGIPNAREMVTREGLRGAKTALWLFSMLAAVLVLWAVIDFDGLFVTFHRIAFRNDFWLLNPRTDLLIRLMPQALFVHLGLKGLSFFLAGMILLMLIMMLLRRSVTAAGKKQDAAS